MEFIVLILMVTWLGYCIYSQVRGSPFERMRAEKEERIRARDYPLHWAVEHGHLEEVKSLLKVGTNPNRQDKGGESPLHKAVFHSRSEEVTSLLMAGANPNLRDVYGNSPLHRAALFGHLEDAKLLLKAGADPNLRTTPHPRVKEMLNPEEIDEWGETPLHVAVEHPQHIDMITVLLDAGADPNIQKHGGWTPLHGAYCGPPSLQGAIVQALVNAGADLEARSTESLCTPLHNSAQCSATATKVLLEAGSNLEARCQYGWTPLHLAVAPMTRNYSDGAIAATKVLLEAGANPNARDQWGQTSLHLAAAHFTAALVLIEPLLMAGADPEARDKKGQTALHIAAANEYTSAVDALIDSGADPDARDNYGKTPNC